MMPPGYTRSPLDGQLICDRCACKLKYSRLAHEHDQEHTIVNLREALEVHKSQWRLLASVLGLADSMFPAEVAAEVIKRLGDEYDPDQPILYSVVDREPGGEK